MMATRTGRQRSQLPACYHEGYLEKRSFKDKTSRKLWAYLCGNTLFFFNDKRDNDYVDKLDLSGLISITDDSSQGRNLDAARLNLQMTDGNIKFSAPNAEARELWKGYIHAVAHLALLSSLNLLPGQLHGLKETIEKERLRKKSVPAPPVPAPPVPDPPVSSCSPYISLKADMPACFRDVTRLEAEHLLEKEAKKGNLLLRPGKEENTFAVSTRQDLNGSVYRHYRVTRKHEGGFAIDVESPVLCATLHDVVNYLVDRTEGVLVPLIIEDAYERRISFIWRDRDNGEMSVQPLQPLPSPPLPPKPPAKPSIPDPEPKPEPPDEGGIYLNDSELIGEPEDPRTEPEKPTERKAMMPPTPAPRKSLPPSSSPTPIRTPAPSNTSQRSSSTPLGQINLELKQRFEQLGMSQQ